LLELFIIIQLKHKQQQIMKIFENVIRMVTTLWVTLSPAYKLFSVKTVVH